MSPDFSRAAAALHAPSSASHREASITSSTSSTPVVVTPPSEHEREFSATNGAAPQHRRPSPFARHASPLRLEPRDYAGSRSVSPRSVRADTAAAAGNVIRGLDGAEEQFLEEEEGDNDDYMAGEEEATLIERPVEDGKSHTPLLKDDRGRPSYDSGSGSARPPFHARRSTFRSRSPDFEADKATRKKYTYAAFFLGLSLVSFVVQTETAVYIQHGLGWKKPYCMLWMTHGSWSLLWPVMFLILRIQKRSVPFGIFWSRHVHQLRTSAQMVRTQQLHLTGQDMIPSPVWHMIKTTAFVTCALTVAGGSWYVAVDMTSSSDLTAIYNCSAFFAYAFSIPLLGDKLRFDKVFSVGLAIIGVLVVAYGDTADDKAPVGDDGTPLPSKEAKNRLLGNMIIGVGSVLYGLYEVLYKKYACPPEGTSAGRGMVFALTVGSMIGTFTVLVLWIPLPLLHWLDIEPFVWPTGYVAWMLAISTLSNATFSGSFLVLISLTSPVLSSVAALLTIFIVALVDWLLPGGKPFSLLALLGGVLIIVAFLLLSWSTYREMQEERRKKMEEDGPLSDEDADEDG